MAARTVPSVRVQAPSASSWRDRRAEPCRPAVTVCVFSSCLLLCLLLWWCSPAHVLSGMQHAMSESDSDSHNHHREQTRVSSASPPRSRPSYKRLPVSSRLAAKVIEPKLQWPATGPSPLVAATISRVQFPRSVDTRPCASIASIGTRREKPCSGQAPLPLCKSPRHPHDLPARRALMC